jgi:hypothetical protein
MANRIVLKGTPPQKEREAAGTITPGDLIELDSSGNVQRHSTVNGNAARLFAIENALEGNDIDDDYASGDRVYYVHARPGDEIQAYLAAGENASIGSFLVSDGDGKLRVHTAASGEPEYLHSIIGIALEAVNISSSALGDSRIEIEII